MSMRAYASAQPTAKPHRHSVRLWPSLRQSSSANISLSLSLSLSLSFFVPSSLSLSLPPSLPPSLSLSLSLLSGLVSPSTSLQSSKNNIALCLELDASKHAIPQRKCISRKHPVYLAAAKTTEWHAGTPVPEKLFYVKVPELVTSYRNCSEKIVSQFSGSSCVGARQEGDSKWEKPVSAKICGFLRFSAQICDSQIS